MDTPEKDYLEESSTLKGVDKKLFIISLSLLEHSLSGAMPASQMTISESSPLSPREVLLLFLISKLGD